MFHSRGRAARVAFALTFSLLALSCAKSDARVGADAKNPDTAPGIGSADHTPDLVTLPSGAPKAGGNLTMSIEGETFGWDPTKSLWGTYGTQVGLAIFDPLVALDKELKPTPYLAESLTPNEDYTKWTIKLRSGVRFHNGEPLNADACIKSFRAIKASAVGGPNAKPIRSIDKVDDLTVALTMEMPWASFPAGLTGQAGVIPAPAQLDDPAGPAHPIGTGPFVFKSWEPGVKFAATKNPDYWRKGLPYFDEVDFKPIPEEAARFSSLQHGDIDLMVTSSEDSSAKLLDLAKDGRFQLVRSTGDNDVTLILINVSKPPLDDLRLRQAMAHALDRKTIAQVSNTDPSLIADSLMQPDSPYYRKQNGYPNYDVAKAKALVDAYTKDNGSAPAFALGSTSDLSVRGPVQAIADQLNQVGFQVTVDVVDSTKFTQNAIVGNYQAQVWRQFGAADPDLNYIWFISDNAGGPAALNMSRNSDPEIDAALKEGRSSLDPALRKQAYGKLQDRLTADLPYLWLNHLRWTAAAAPDLRGLQGQPLPNGELSAGLVGGVIPVTAMWRER